MIVPFFRGALTQEYFSRFKFTPGDCRAQQLCESLAVLVALRVWSERWVSKRIVLAVRSDSVAALTILVNFKAGGEHPGLIAREVALDVADGAYTPQVVEHVPGDANKIADILSRWISTTTPSLPQVLHGVPEVTLPLRDDSYYRTLYFALKQFAPHDGKCLSCFVLLLLMLTASLVVCTCL